MSFPFAKWPTWGKFFSKVLNEYDGQIKQYTFTVNGVKTKMESITRTEKGEFYSFEFVNIDRREVMAPTTLESVCLRLGLDHRDFMNL